MNMKATTKQANYINYLTSRLNRDKSTRNSELTQSHLNWGLENACNMTTNEASEWINHLKQLIRTVNGIAARHAVNGRGIQI